MIDEMNVVFSSDDNYCRHLGVAIYSLLKHNRDFERINIYVINNGISEENIACLQTVIRLFGNAQMSIVDFDKWKDMLHLNMAWQISISSYARLFLASILPDTLRRVIYLDCDVIVCDSLKKMWETELNENILGAVQDIMRPEWKEAVEIDKDKEYLNAGVLLINLKEWRKADIESQCIRYIDEHKGCVIHHDQGVLNGVFQGHWTRLPLRYNLMTIHFFYSLEKQRKFFRDQADFYLEQEIKQAREQPAILHFTPSFTTRPWVRGCKHPLKHLYWDFLKETPWKDIPPMPDPRKWYVKLIEWRYRNLPF